MMNKAAAIFKSFENNVRESIVLLNAKFFICREVTCEGLMLVRRLARHHPEYMSSENLHTVMVELINGVSITSHLQYCVSQMIGIFS